MDEELDGSLHDTNIQPPTAVAAWVGMVDSSSTYGGGRSLSKHNDSGESFEDIATIIESKPEGLFVA